MNSIPSPVFSIIERRVRRILCVSVLVLALGGSCFQSPALAQVSTSGIAGTVTDQSGAIVPDAHITVKNEATNLERETTTTGSGVFVIQGLPVGVYTIRTEKSGFQASVITQVRTEVGKMTSVDVALHIGNVAQQISVTARPAQLTTTSATVGTLITSKELADLPLNGRSWISLNFLAPSAAGFHGLSNFVSNITASITPGNVVVNGLRGGNNVYLIDGVSLAGQEDTSIIAVIPPLEALTEFRTQTSNVSAEYAGGAAAFVTAATKSGTNALHGKAWEFLRNDALDARQFFDPTVPELRRNQFGFTLGGPIKRNRTFFFGSYEGFRQVQGQTFVNNFPTAAQRAGDLSSLSSTPILDPLTGKPFPGNVIPANRISPQITQYLNAFIPLPNTNLPVGAGNSRTAGITPLHYNTFAFRIDHQLSDKSSIFGRHLFTQTTSETAQPNPNFTRSRFNRSQNLAVGYSRIISPTVGVDIRAGWNRWFLSEPVGNKMNVNMLTALGIAPGAFGFTQDPNVAQAPPQITVSGLSGLGGAAFGRPRIISSNAYYLDGSVTFARGSHAIKMGVEIQRFLLNFPEVINGTGAFTFNGFFTGLGFADFLLDTPRLITAVADPFFQDEWRWGQGAWFQDDWKVTSKLTLNLGFRYDHDGRWNPHSRRVSNFLFDTPPVLRQITSQNPPANLGPALVRGRTNLLSPRFGFAYQLRGNTVIRGGYGIYWNPMTGDPTVEASVNPPFVSPLVAFFEPSDLATFNPANPLASSTTPLAGPTAFNINWRDGYVQEWNATVEQRLGANVVSIAYVGNKGTNLNTLYDANLAPPGPGPIQPRRPFTNVSSTFFFDTDRDSWYHALQLKATRQFTRNLSFIASYAFQKALDNGSGTFIEGANDTFQQPLNKRAEKGLSEFDVRHVFSVSYIYSLPFGDGQRWASAVKGVGGKLITGWQIQGISRLFSGFPVQVANATDNLNNGGLGYPNRVCNPNDTPGGRSTAQKVAEFFNTSCFVPAPAFTFGNTSRNPVITPNTKNTDFTLQKDTKISERASLQFRAEFFNIFNRPDFSFTPFSFGRSAAATLLFGSPDFGKLLSVTQDARQIQFGLALSF